MTLYAILRRNGWKSPEDLEAAAARSKQVGEQMQDDVRWIRTYVFGESDGSLGSVCIYEGSGEEALRQHASRAELPIDEVLPIAKTVIVRSDPE